ncbi:hypothetical protein E2562_026952 [Oryza meyeriana var. granulata]|uniref:Sulfotransferase n=1 Tax=Oryza meyeriana var. granulata TaxID=110450 RepID=A0A6G1BNE8_9ORYZ|nr:hypothetical protein E2562_026952 [Oryza meyeriana var. granulata]
MFCEGFSPFGPFWNHILEYWKASMERPDKVMFLKCEDIKSDPVLVVRKLADILGVPFTKEEDTDGIPEEVVKSCNFETLSNLKVNEIGATHGRKRTIDNSIFPFVENNSIFFRKGRVGDWVNHISKEMGARMDHIVQEKFRGYGLTF